MSIDWSKAPYDAEAGYLGTSQAYDAWYRRDGAGQVQQMCPAAGCSDWTWMGGRKDFPVGAELRPVAENQWNGEGLPPVGAVCEHVGDKIESVEVIAHRPFKGHEHDDLLVVFVTDSDVSFSSPSCFRPIRTAEQIAAEERAQAIEDMWSVYWKPEPQTAKEALGLLWDAGYRKQEAAQ